jgi:hypothetical protein
MVFILFRQYTSNHNATHYCLSLSFSLQYNINSIHFCNVTGLKKLKNRKDGDDDEGKEENDDDKR